MKIKMDLWGQLKKSANSNMVEIETDSNDLESIIRTLAKRNDMLSKILISEEECNRSILAFINDEQVEWDSPLELEEGTTISLMSPMSGG